MLKYTLGIIFNKGWYLTPSGARLSKWYTQICAGKVPSICGSVLWRMHASCGAVGDGSLARSLGANPPVCQRALLGTPRSHTRREEWALPLSHKALNLSVSSHTSQGEGWNQTQFDERLNHHLEEYFSLTSHLLLEPVSIKPNSIPKGQFCACSEEAQGWDSPEQEASSGPAVGTLHTRFLPILSSASSPAAIAGWDLDEQMPGDKVAQWYRIVSSLRAAHRCGSKAKSHSNTSHHWDPIEHWLEVRPSCRSLENWETCWKICIAQRAVWFREGFLAWENPQGLHWAVPKGSIHALYPKLWLDVPCHAVCVLVGSGRTPPLVSPLRRIYCQENRVLQLVTGKKKKRYSVIKSGIRQKDEMLGR